MFKGRVVRNGKRIRCVDKRGCYITHSKKIHGSGFLLDGGHGTFNSYRDVEQYEQLVGKNPTKSPIKGTGNGLDEVISRLQTIKPKKGRGNIRFEI